MDRPFDSPYITQMYEPVSAFNRANFSGWYVQLQFIIDLIILNFSSSTGQNIICFTHSKSLKQNHLQRSRRSTKFKEILSVILQRLTLRDGPANL